MVAADENGQPTGAPAVANLNQNPEMPMVSQPIPPQFYQNPAQINAAAAAAAALKQPGFHGQPMYP